MTLIGAALLSGVALADLTSESAQVVTASPDWSTVPTFTVGEAVGPGSYLPPGILDGIGSAFAVDDKTIRVYVNHELPGGQGYPYQLANGLWLSGARISWFDIDRDTLVVTDAGLGYNTIYDRFGNLVTDATQLNDGDGLSRFCSARGVHAGELGFVDDIHFAGEEIDNGSQYALDIATGELWAVPAMGKASWENVTPVDTGDPDTVGLIIGDDEAPAPLYLFMGQKNAVGDGSFLDRNGLASGQLYFLKLQDAANPEEFNGTESTATGEWQPIDVLDGSGNQRSATDLRAEAFGKGGFQIARPEDVHENPDNPTQFVLADTGRGSLFPSDDWGKTYIINLDFSEGGIPSGATVRIVYDGDDAGAGQFSDPDNGLRSPDNLTWASDGFIYIQEDSATQNNTFGGVSGEESSIWKLNPENGELERIAQVDRSAIPTEQIDEEPDTLGSWETSGILDVTHLFRDDDDGGNQTILIADVQAHSLTGAPIDDRGLVEGGQLVFLISGGDEG
jgi:hypothetical protein